MTQRRFKPPNKFAQTISHAGKRLEGHPIILGLVVSAIGALLALVAWSSVNGVPLQDRYQLKAMVPVDAPIVQEGDAVRIAGQLAGLVTGVEPRNGARELEMELRPGFAPVGRDARARVTVKSIIYLTYVELLPGNLDDPMPEGGTIPLRRSGSGVDILEVVQLFDRKAREALKRATFDAGLAVAGRGEALNAALADLAPATRQLTSQLEALTREPGAIARSIEGAGRVLRGLGGERPDDVDALLRSAGPVAETLGKRSSELGESIELLAPFERELLATAPLADPVLDDAAALSETLTPSIDELTTALPDLNRALALGDELRRQSARLTARIRPVIEASIPVLRGLQPIVASADPLLGPLGRLVDALAPYAGDITDSAKGLISATRTRYPEGQTAPGTSALRYAPVLTCHRARNPFPEPGETRRQSASC